MKEKIIRCAIYDRVSTDGQVKEGLSLDAQQEALTEYALSHHYKIVEYYSPQEDAEPERPNPAAE